MRIEQQLIFLPFHNDSMHKQLFCNALKQNRMLTLKILADTLNCSTKFDTDCRLRMWIRGLDERNLTKMVSFWSWLSPSQVMTVLPPNVVDLKSGQKWHYNNNHYFYQGSVYIPDTT